MAEVHGTVYVTRKQSKLFHTTPDCPALSRSDVLAKPRNVYPHRELCGRCKQRDPPAPENPRNGASDAGDTCGTCGGSLTAEDHTACVCDFLDAIHEVPRDAEFCPTSGYPEPVGRVPA